MTSQVVELRDRRIGKAIVIAMSCEIYKFANMEDTYKVQSESDPKRFYIVRLIDSDPSFCTCKDWELRSRGNPKHLCKHLRAVIYADRYGLIRDESEQDKNELPKLSYLTDEYEV